jgi:hypothetical protein
MSRAQNKHDASGILSQDPVLGILTAYGLNVPVANSPGYAPGCQFIKANASSIGTTTYVNIGSKLACNFVAGGLYGAISVAYVYGDAAPIDGAFWTADRQYLLLSIIARITVAGTDGGTVQAQVRKANNGIAIASGAALHSSNINLKGTVDTNQIMALSITPGITTIAERWSIGLDVTGVTTAARGVVSLLLLPM